MVSLPATSFYVSKGCVIIACDTSVKLIHQPLYFINYRILAFLEAS
jgi:hypothetical protein